MLKLVEFGIEDLDMTEEYRHCKYIHIIPLSSGLLGKIIPIPTVGRKIMWCKFAKSLPTGDSLKELIKKYKHKPRKRPDVINLPSKLGSFQINSTISGLVSIISPV